MNSAIDPSRRIRLLLDKKFPGPAPEADFRCFTGIDLDVHWIHFAIGQVQPEGLGIVKVGSLELSMSLPAIQGIRYAMGEHLIAHGYISCDSIWMDHLAGPFPWLEKHGERGMRSAYVWNRVDQWVQEGRVGVGRDFDQWSYLRKVIDCQHRHEYRVAVSLMVESADQHGVFR